MRLLTPYCVAPNVVLLIQYGLHHPHQDSKTFPLAWVASIAFISLFKPSYAIGSVPSLLGHAIACRWRSLPRVRRHRAGSLRGSSKRVLPWQVTMDQLICATLSHIHYWYEVGMSKVPAVAPYQYSQLFPLQLSPFVRCQAQQR